MTAKPKENLVVPKIIVNATPQSFEAEQFRILRTSINFQTKKQNVHSLIVSSSSHSEGKTTTVVNLSAVYAEEGKNVLIIDGDMRTPMIHQIFHKSNTLGLSNVLTKNTSFAEAIQSTFIPGLSILTSGPVPVNPVKLLGSNMLEQLITQATTDFDVVIFDSPPVLLVSDAQLIADKCQCSILVVNSKETQKDLAFKAKSILDLTDSQLLGAVLNESGGHL
ncbi:MAG: CpsD/CapB family tyrosine-protein kinase [Planococcus sp. (in: firmicutes)]